MNKEEIKEHILTQISYGYVDYGIHDEETLDYIKEVVSNYDKLAKDYNELKEIHYSIQGGRFSGKTYILHLQKKIKELEKEIKKLQKQAMLGKSYKKLYGSVKKQKDDVVEYIKYLIKRLEEFDIPKRKETGAFWYQVMGELEELLRMLGEII